MKRSKSPSSKSETENKDIRKRRSHRVTQNKVKNMNSENKMKYIYFTLILDYDETLFNNNSIKLKDASAFLKNMRNLINKNNYIHVHLL